MEGSERSLGKDRDPPCSHNGWILCMAGHKRNKEKVGVGGMGLGGGIRWNKGGAGADSKGLEI